MNYTCVTDNRAYLITVHLPGLKCQLYLPWLLGDGRGTILFVVELPKEPRQVQQQWLYLPWLLGRHNFKKETSYLSLCYTRSQGNCSYWSICLCSLGHATTNISNLNCSDADLPYKVELQVLAFS